MHRFAARMLCGAVVVLLGGCGKVEVTGNYRDEKLPDLQYEFRPDGTWTAIWESRVPSGIFAQSAARRLEGTYALRGRRLELACTNVQDRDPAGLGFVPVRVFDGDSGKLFDSYNHGFLFEDGRLVPAEPDRPFGGGVLLPVSSGGAAE